MEKEIFIRKFVKSIYEGNAAIFAGAGTSVSAGFVDWQKLVKPFTKEIGLDIKKENNYLEMIQYFINSKMGNRGDINQEIVNCFSSIEADTDVINILTRLPISTYWTTNYDKLIEKGLSNNNRRADVKRNTDDLAISIPESDAIVYKMHGDVESPKNAVISKDDYERYDDKNSLFITALRGDLVSKTFLFIGFSFEDPNLDHILAKINILLGDNKRTHYNIQKRISKDDSYELIKQNLKIEDLKRYGIETILVDDYKEIPELLLKIEHEYLKKTVFISGSISDYNSKWTEEKVNQFCYDLSRLLVVNNYKVISGFGLGIGSSVINGALDEIYKSKYRHINKYLSLFPFPQNDNGEKSLKKRWSENREQMIDEAGICIFIFGNKKIGVEVVPASGMLEEFEIAKEKKKIIIPVASTDFVAKDIFYEMKKSEKYAYLNNHWDKLESETDAGEICSIIEEIIKE